MANQLPTIRNAGAARLVDHLDAHLFTGDTFHAAEEREALRAYLRRWAKRLDELAEDAA